MGRRPLSNEELYSDLVTTIREKIEEQINDEYTDLKIQYLDNLEYRLEARRNDVVKGILDSIDIMFKQDELDMSPVIQIKVIKKIERGR